MPHRASHGDLEVQGTPHHAFSLNFTHTQTPTFLASPPQAVPQVAFPTLQLAATCRAIHGRLEHQAAYPDAVQGPVAPPPAWSVPCICIPDPLWAGWGSARLLVHRWPSALIKGPMASAPQESFSTYRRSPPSHRHSFTPPDAPSPFREGLGAHPPLLACSLESDPSQSLPVFPEGCPFLSHRPTPSTHGAWRSVLTLSSQSGPSACPQHLDCLWRATVEGQKQISYYNRVGTVSRDM